MESAVIDDSVGFDFSELNSEAFKNMMNSVVNDEVGLDESETSSGNIVSRKIPGVGISVSHVDYL